MEIKGFSKESAGIFRQRKDYTITFENGDTITFPLKSLPTNITDIIADDLPFPTPPNKFDKEKKAFVQNLADANYIKEKAKIEAARTYALVIYGIDETQFPIEGKNLIEKIETLINTEIPLGYFAKVAGAVGELSGITPEEFR